MRRKVCAHCARQPQHPCSRQRSRLQGRGLGPTASTHLHAMCGMQRQRSCWHALLAEACTWNVRCGMPAVECPLCNARHTRPHNLNQRLQYTAKQGQPAGPSLSHDMPAKLCMQPTHSLPCSSKCHRPNVATSCSEYLARRPTSAAGWRTSGTQGEGIQDIQRWHGGGSTGWCQLCILARAQQA